MSPDTETLLIERLDRLESMLRSLLARNNTEPSNPVTFAELKAKLMCAPPDEQRALINAWNRRKAKEEAAR